MHEKDSPLLEHVIAEHPGIVRWVDMTPARRAVIHHALHAQHDEGHFTHVHKMTFIIGGPDDA